MASSSSSLPTSIRSLLSQTPIQPQSSFPAGRKLGSLKIPWKKDPALDAAIERDKPYSLCSRVVRSVLLEPGRCISLKYLENRRSRLRLPVGVKTFLNRHPNLLEVYRDRVKPNGPMVPFLRPSKCLLLFLEAESEIRLRNEGFVMGKLVKLLMMARDRALPVEKVLNVKRLFGFPDDLVTDLVERNRDLVQVEKGHIRLVKWDDCYAKSAVELKAEEESELTQIAIRPNFNVKLPKGFSLKKEMKEWVRDWLELPYFSPYKDSSNLNTASIQMEKRNIAVLHEFLSLTIQKRAPVASIGKFCNEFRLSNAFTNAFTRHPGIFYLSLKGGIETAMLREAYSEDGVLLERDPLMEIMERFKEMMDEGFKEYLEAVKRKKEELQNEMALVAKKNAEMEMKEEI
ncbi:hypothetical protein LUZ60_005295 [Juncus effusus]|nr:hypothetical protein LUZ60_005295 [Juncus effusus]